MTVKYVVWCCSIFQMMNFVKWRELLLSFCSQWTLCRDPVIWNAARSPSGVMSSACGESRCTVGEGREVYGCAWVWRSLCEGVLSLASQRQFPLQTSAALWDRLHNRRLHSPLCVTETTKPYGTNYCSRVHDRLWCVSVSVFHFDKKM